MSSPSLCGGVTAARVRRFDSHQIVILIVIAGVALLCAAAPGSAFADGRAHMSAADVARAYESAVADAEDDTVIEPRASAAVVGVPSDPSEGVTIGSGADTVRVVPDIRAAAAARASAGNGRGVYRGADGRTATVVEPVGVGVRIATVSTDDGRDTQRYSYRLGLPEGAVAYLTAEGAVRIVHADGRALVTILAPWARDAGGRSLPTFYSLEASTLVQTVNTRGARFPVVADPRIENTGFLGLTGVKIWFTRSETESLYRQKTQISTGTALAGLACGLLTGPLSPVCAAVVIYTLGDFNVNIDQAHARNNCLTLEIRLIPPPASLPDWDDGDGNHCVHPS